MIVARARSLLSDLDRYLSAFHTFLFQGNLKNSGDSSTFGKRDSLLSPIITPNQQSNHHIPDSAIPSSSVKEMRLGGVRITIA